MTTNEAAGIIREAFNGPHMKLSFHSTAICQLENALQFLEAQSSKQDEQKTVSQKHDQQRDSGTN